ncbi:MAG: beta-eliminating lyase-related protein [Ignavibacteriaceae bacterium]|nr:beta-eliminating lyase-related protein [Ignavibacteriaceae bacterium]
MNKLIDLRSDTVTKPSAAMRKAMYEAEVGDDVFKEDPTVNELERFAAELLDKEAALFVSSGVMGNQICLNVLTNPGDEVICEKNAHIFNYESGSPSALSGIQIYPVEGKLGVFTPAQAEEAIRPISAYYMPRTKVIEVENTHNRASGAIHPLGNIITLKNVAKKHNLFFHLDGARIWNASAATGISVAEYASHFDTVSCCLSKGLGAPVGSLIAGSKDFIDKAFRVRKAWGGGMRQAGFLAAAGLFALKNNRERLKEDHEKAQLLAKAIAANPKLKVNMEAVQTNIIIFEPLTMSVEVAQAKCKEKGLLLSVGTATALRAVTHLDVSFEEMEKTIEILNGVFS